ncbi:MAG: DUF4142 domain-containing protein [Pyrinomonadaceae bacterium]
MVSLALTAFCWGCSSDTTTTNNGNGNVNTTTTTTTTSTTANANTATTANANTNANASATAAGGADKEFAMKAAGGGMAEVELGRLAMKNGQSAAVKQFGQRMVTDHSKANEELKAIAASKGITLPAEMSADGKEMMEKLSKLKGEEFDRAYTDGMVEDHTKDVAEFKKEAETGTDKDIKAFAAKTLPVIQGHLQMVQGLAPKERKEAAQEKPKPKI